MKSKIIIAGLVCIITAPPAPAVTKCVALNSSTTCEANYGLYQNHPDWSAICTTNGVSTPIKGIGVCSSTKGASAYATATELEMSSAADNNKYCWCRMISPVVSHWISATSFASNDECSQNCAYECGDRIVYGNAVFHMVNSLSD